MTEIYKSVFDFRGMKFGWKDKKLYRLPQNYNKRFLPLLELSNIKIGLKTGYKVNGKPLSMSQLKSMQTKEKFVMEVTEDSDVPF